MKIRVWYIANVPDNGIKVEVKSLAEAKAMKKTMVDVARYVEKRTGAEIVSDVCDVEVFEDNEWIGLEASSLGDEAAALEMV